MKNTLRTLAVSAALIASLAGTATAQVEELSPEVWDGLPPEARELLLQAAGTNAAKATRAVELKPPPEVRARRASPDAWKRGLTVAPAKFGQIDEFTYQRTKEDLIRWETANDGGAVDLKLMVNYPKPIDKRDLRKPNLVSRHEASTISVAFKPFVREEQIMALFAKQGAKVQWQSRLVRNLYQVEIVGGIQQNIDAFLDMSDVLYAEPNYLARVGATPNDPQWTNGRGALLPDALWGMMSSNEYFTTWTGASRAAEAWDEWTGSASFRIAVIDSGTQWDHPDLKSNIYFSGDVTGDANNDGRPGIAGLDDDGDGLIDEDGAGKIPGQTGYNTSFAADDNENGYKDDQNGWNPNLTPPRGLNFDIDWCGNNHGTHVAGTIAAVGNNSVGVVGVNWQASIVVIRCSEGDQCCESGNGPNCGSLSGTAQGIEYAAMTGIRVSNNSYGSDSYNQG
jgi:subtilisin family serine protease